MQVVVRVGGQRGGERRALRREAGDWGVGARFFGDGRGPAGEAAGLGVAALETRFGGWERGVVDVVVGWECGGGGVVGGGLLG